ncbi:hypothetical protein NHL50_00450 [Acidimicrobiia bacterium EGI L10123]|uniref:hypothetical protein n=1 Tax=Salinilacustrithrix flava TaxID=2957203 RepID=UPI003D7C191C|nr:hypothetical protein [Acidimicrobiia bacterium EGI L10123]
MGSDVLAITGPALSRRRELFALTVTAVAALAAVVVPTLYVAVLPVACGAVALSAPAGRRLPAALAVWAPVSLAVVVGGMPIA